MSVVEDLRQVLQDFLAPELRAVAAKFDVIESKIDAVNARVSSVERTMDTRISALEKTVEARFSATEKTMEARFSATEKTMETRFSAAEEKANVRQEMILVQFQHVKNLLDVDKRLLRLESQSAGALGKNA
jgi:hypothetical protein